MIKKSEAANVWLDYAREDLVEEYSALNRPELVAKFRQELSVQ